MHRKNTNKPPGEPAPAVIQVASASGFTWTAMLAESLIYAWISHVFLVGLIIKNQQKKVFFKDFKTSFEG